MLQKQVYVKHGDLSTDKVPALSLLLALGGSFMSSCTLKKGIGAREKRIVQAVAKADNQRGNGMFN